MLFSFRFWRAIRAMRPARAELFSLRTILNSPRTKTPWNINSCLSWAGCSSNFTHKKAPSLQWRRGFWLGQGDEVALRFPLTPLAGVFRRENAP